MLQLALNLQKRLLLLLFTFIIGYFVVSVVSVMIIGKFGTESTPAMRILSVLQDIILFMMPAIATAIIVTRQPAELLAIDRKPALSPLLIAICVLISSVPAMNAIVWLNEQMPFPQSWLDALQTMEDNANALVLTLQGPHTIGNLIVAILVVGVFAGLTEELLFRGAFQRLMITGGVNPHAAIWIAAAVFSLLHMQAFGFFPRMLLGAFFGYALYWTRSLWVPIILHTLNNTIYIITQYVSYNPDAPFEKSAIDQVGAGNSFLLVATSAAMITAGMWILYKGKR